MKNDGRTIDCCRRRRKLDRSCDRACGQPAGESNRAVSRVPLTLDLVARMSALPRPVRQEYVSPAVAHACSSIGRSDRARARCGTIRRRNATVRIAPTVAHSIFGRTRGLGVQNRAKLMSSPHRVLGPIGAGNSGNLFASRALLKQRCPGKQVKICRLPPGY
jgi:hypothetical protein